MKTRTVVLINGPFGVGKSAVSRLLRQRIGRSVRFDPERIGYVLRRLPASVPGSASALDDYQQLQLWRRLTIRCAVFLSRLDGCVLIPMTSTERDVLDQISSRITAQDCRVVHVCLVAAEATLRRRLEERGEDPTIEQGRWVYAHSIAASRAHQGPGFDVRIDTDSRAAESVADVVEAMLAGDQELG